MASEGFGIEVVEGGLWCQVSLALQRLPDKTHFHQHMFEGCTYLDTAVAMMSMLRDKSMGQGEDMSEAI